MRERTGDVMSNPFKKTSVFMVVGLWLVLGSCLPEPLDIQKVPVVKSEIVVSSQIIPDSSLVVFVTKTVGALDASDDSDPLELLNLIAVNDAIVTLDGPQGKDTLTFLQNGAYRSLLTPFEPGEVYHLHVNSAEMGEVRATTKVKAKVDFTEIDAELFYNGFNDTLAEITYTFIDSPEPNWYMVNVQEVEQEDFVENLLNPRAHTILMTDEEFNDKSFTEKFRVFPRDYNPGDTIAVTLSNISEDYFQFMKLRIDNRFSFVEYISEPINYPSNVQGGKGYFNLYVPDVRLLVFD